MADIKTEKLSLRFGGTAAVDGVDLAVPEATFFALLGPSGCGKTTLLRLIAGLERPDGGTIRLGGRPVAGAGLFVEPGERCLGMVFQSYALWPHMTVAGNVAFGLNRLSGPDRARRVAEALRSVGLEEFARRRPHELSGGQRQRVALARSLAVRPGLILLDEPLANLDAHLRQSMLAEFRRIHHQSGTTFVFVTHDQSEALSVAGLVGVMNRGRLEQVAPPDQVFRRPATPMVARFVGQGCTLPVEALSTSDGRVIVRLGPRNAEVPGVAGPGPAWLCLRPRDLRLAEGAGDIAARVIGLRFEGGDHVLSALPEGIDAADPLEVRSEMPVALGTLIGLSLKGGWVLPREGAARTVAAAPQPVGA
ncbi:ABC transporter ATP-binding protein [Rhodovulum euryhalinum]|uniref:Iron(III) transport system ATP-binding protein n=1 Tax=Rhodovulum euryhalinum TaxID=35805 RepID=A0A4R2KNK9_9RHOB|nr:ABC transporter ATP-binding protein [Rhodovulum euryhalinum]TCO74167.1 iron(III) transport system ATP-binding protein [Rhodovulum euryhalinum]